MGDASLVASYVNMFVAKESIVIKAPIERCFALSTSVELVQRELKMKPVSGRTSGLVTGGDTVRWEGWQLGFPSVHHSLISGWEPPHFFQDRMIAGRFAAFEHDHRFRQVDGGTLLEDEVRFTMPFGFPGRLAGRWVLVSHIKRLVRRRFAMLRQIAEGNEWRDVLARASDLGEGLQ